MLGLGGASLFALTLASDTRAQEDQVESRGFAIPDTRAAKALVDSVEGHIRAQRWPETVHELQRLIRDYDGDLLSGEFELDGGSSEGPVHAGAAEYARRRLAALPRVARETYVQAFEADAKLLLEAALGNSDRAGLARVGSLYPLTHSALRAWCSLGDLELELGNTTEALLAWSRALAYQFQDSEFKTRNLGDWKRAQKRLNDHNGKEAAALSKRVSLVLASYAGQSEGLIFGEVVDLGPELPDSFHSGNQDQLGRELRLPGPGEGVETLPERSPGSWSEPFILPEHPFIKTHRSPFHAIRSGDLVLVSDSMRISAVNAYSGRLVWQSEDAPGWDQYYERVKHEWTPAQRESNDFFQGLDNRHSLIAPAATDSIVVAPLQIPITHSSNSKYTSINITRIIPSRRLFAFDVDTGKQLWQHMPQLGWDGESGTFEERTRVCGPPVIAGGRVLVPSYRHQGRIDFHIACYDLRTGERLWSTGLISGQRELNMFGRPENAFSAPPVRVQGDRVVALTQLGSVAALDLFSGSILWETLYSQLGLQSAQFRARYRRPTWRNAPPIISGDVVIAAPVDSNDLIGLDLESGSLLWSRDQATLKHGKNRVDLLLGADRNTIYLAGTQLMALNSPIDLRTAPDVKWTHRTDAMATGREAAWPALAKNTILLPTRDEHFRVDRLLGHNEPGMAWASQGNVLLTEGAFFTINNRRLDGYFEWGTLIQRARSEHESDPSNLPAALGLASLLTDRGVSRMQEMKAELARPFAEEAVEVLEPFLGRAEPKPTDRFIAQFHRSLMALARTQRYVADPASIETLRRARKFALNSTELLATLLEQQSQLHDSRSEAWFEVLSTLESQCGDHMVNCEPIPSSVDKLITDYEFVPRLPRFGLDDTALVELPVDLWVWLTRAAANAQRGNYEAAFADLHRILRVHRSTDLVEGTAAELAIARIGRVLKKSEGAGYERFEAEAQAHLESAREMDSLEELKLVSVLFPHSTASVQAHDAMLEASIRAGDAESVARILQAELPEAWQPASASVREIELVCNLANMLREAGNQTYFRGVVRSLAATRSKLIVNVPGFEEQTLGALEQALSSEIEVAPASETATFDARCSKQASFVNRWVFQGYVPGATEESEKLRQIAIFSSKKSLMALSSNEPTKPLWIHEYQVRRRRDLPATQIAFSPGRIVLYDDDYLVGIDRETGEEVWDWEATQGDLSSITCEDGMVVALRMPKSREPALHAMDAHTGTELWELRLTDKDLMPRLPLLGSGKMVFLPNLNRQRVVVRDLFSSRING